MNSRLLPRQIKLKYNFNQVVPSKSAMAITVPNSFVRIMQFYDEYAKAFFIDNKSQKDDDKSKHVVYDFPLLVGVPYVSDNEYHEITKYSDFGRSIIRQKIVNLGVTIHCDLESDEQLYLSQNDNLYHHKKPVDERCVNVCVQKNILIGSLVFTNPRTKISKNIYVDIAKQTTDPNIPELIALWVNVTNVVFKTKCPIVVEFDIE